MDNAVERRKRHLSEGDESSGQQDARRVRSMEVAQAPNGQQQQEPALAVVHPYMLDTNSKIHRPPSPPESDCSHDEDNDDDTTDDDSDDHGDAALAGYEYCQAEAIRYLMEEEKLDANHPVVRQLQQHLDSRRTFANSNPGAMNPSKP